MLCYVMLYHTTYYYMMWCDVTYDDMERVGICLKIILSSIRTTFLFFIIFLFFSSKSRVFTAQKFYEKINAFGQCAHLHS